MPSSYKTWSPTAVQGSAERTLYVYHPPPNLSDGATLLLLPLQPLADPASSCSLALLADGINASFESSIGVLAYAPLSPSRDALSVAGAVSA